MHSLFSSFAAISLFALASSSFNALTSFGSALAGGSLIAALTVFSRVCTLVCSFSFRADRFAMRSVWADNVSAWVPDNCRYAQSTARGHLES